ncbi:MAG: hypothetical protein EB163_09595, partial [Nitrososphaeria archaeon]|nr:hypothetical protein [Nitrososphaeria archaeon]
KVVKTLFLRYKNAKDLSNAKLKDVEKIIHSIGFYHVKAKRIIDVAKIIHTQYLDRVPKNMDALVSLPGVPVDIHVHRISNRLGLVETKTPEQTEQALMEKIPKKFWLQINDTFVMYGQNICKPISPMCNVCKIKKSCKYYSTKNAA